MDYRRLVEFQESCLIYRTPDRLLHANFSLEILLSFQNISPALLTSGSGLFFFKQKTAYEILVLQAQNLIWHEVEQHRNQAIRLRAHAGFVRATYELDSITRMALAYCPMELLEKYWDTTSFFETGVDHARVSWDEVKARLNAVDRDGMQFDLEGNAKGIRRFCVAVRDGQRIACLLTVAEAATPLRDQAAHIERIREVLIEQRDAIEAAGPAMPADDDWEVSA